jgi:hypothetical protein
VLSDLEDPLDSKDLKGLRESVGFLELLVHLAIQEVQVGLVQLDGLDHWA